MLKTKTKAAKAEMTAVALSGDEPTNQMANKEAGKVYKYAMSEVCG